MHSQTGEYNKANNFVFLIFNSTTFIIYFQHRAVAREAVPKRFRVCVARFSWRSFGIMDPARVPLRPEPLRVKTLSRSNPERMANEVGD